MAYNYVWPPSLPRSPRPDGYTERPGLNILRTPVDAGPAKQRRRSNRPDQISCVFRLTATELATFQTFVNSTLAGGTLRFGMPHPRTGVMSEVRLVPADDGVYSLSIVGSRIYDVSLTLEVLP